MAVPRPRAERAAREALQAQLRFELDQMNLLGATARSSAERHTIVIRPAFPSTFFTSDMFCGVSPEFPTGCRSGTSMFNPNFAFPLFEPEASYEYVWAGNVGELAGSALLARRCALGLRR